MRWPAYLGLGAGKPPKYHTYHPPLAFSPPIPIGAGFSRTSGLVLRHGSSYRRFLDHPGREDRPWHGLGPILHLGRLADSHVLQSIVGHWSLSAVTFFLPVLSPIRPTRLLILQSQFMAYLLHEAFCDYLKLQGPPPLLSPLHCKSCHTISYLMTLLHVSFLSQSILNSL